jgi:RNA polymerase sigma factor (sigma-70 family)
MGLYVRYSSGVDWHGKDWYTKGERTGRTVTDEQLAVEIQQELAAAAAARERRDEKEAKQHGKNAAGLQDKLWCMLLNEVDSLNKLKQAISCLAAKSNPCWLTDLVTKLDDYGEDEDLAIKIQREESEEQSRARLWNRREESIGWLVRKFCGYAGGEGLPVEEFLRELRQEAYIKFDQTVPRYNPLRGASVWTLLEGALRNHLISVTRRSKKRYDFSPDYTPPLAGIGKSPVGSDSDDAEPNLDEELTATNEEVKHTGQEIETIPDPNAPEPDYMVWCRQLRAAIDDVCEELVREGHVTLRQMTAWRLYHLEGKTQTEIAALMRQSVGWVNKAIQKVDPEFRRRFAEKYPDFVEQCGRKPRPGEVAESERRRGRKRKREKTEGGDESHA